MPYEQRKELEDLNAEELQKLLETRLYLKEHPEEFTKHYLFMESAIEQDIVVERIIERIKLIKKGSSDRNKESD